MRFFIPFLKPEYFEDALGGIRTHCESQIPWKIKPTRIKRLCFTLWHVG